MIKNEIPAILEYIKVVRRKQTRIQLDLVEMYSGNIVEYIEASLYQQLSKEAAERAVQRIAPINVMPRIVDKLATTYNEGVKRTFVSDSDKDIITNIYEDAEINKVLSSADKLHTLHRYFALEPYYNSDEAKYQVRVLGGHQFCVYTNSNVDPSKETHFIKFMGQVDRSAILQGDPNYTDETVCELYYIYTKDEFMALDSDGIVRQEFYPENNQEGINSLGRIPFVYAKSNEFTLMPAADEDFKRMAIVIPVLIADLNYAHQFMAHSILYGIDIDPSGLSGNPDSFWNVKSVEGENKSPQLGALSPTVQAQDIITSATFQLCFFLDSRSVKVGSVGNMDGGNAASGIAKIIDESDTSIVRKEKRKVFKQVEKNLLSLITLLYNQDFDKIKDDRYKAKLSDRVNMTVEFQESQVIADPAANLNVIAQKLSLSLTSKARALADANPDLNEQELEVLQAEIDEDKTNAVVEAPMIDEASNANKPANGNANQSVADAEE